MEIDDIEEIDLKKDIEDLVAKFGATKVYLFGSRGYNTGSTRSDVDIIIETDQKITMTNFEYFYEKHKYLDLFCIEGNTIKSVVTGASINNEDGLDHLNPVLLWSKEKSYQNQSFYKQNIFTSQSFSPSVMPHPKAYGNLKMKINHLTLPSKDDIQFYFQEALVDYDNETYISAISMIGCACERIVDDLIVACKKKNSYDNPNDTTFQSDIESKTLARQRLIGIQNYCCNGKNKLFFKKYVKNIDDVFSMFEIIRQYRNDADHPSGFAFYQSDCDYNFGLINIHLLQINNIIIQLNLIYK
jgi:predicted nucleotidyltransferase